MKSIEVFTDGSATTKNLPGGWAYVLVVDGSKHSEGSGYSPSATNNDMELAAAINGLAAAKDLIKTDVDALAMPEVTLCSDSQLILGWSNGSYKFKQTEPEKIAEYKLLRSAVDWLRAKTKWIKGHSGNEYNERCDQLANEARTGIKKSRKTKEPRTYRWNNTASRSIAFWDFETNSDTGCAPVITSDKNTINNPGGMRNEHVLEAMCRVVAELIEIEEKRKK